MDATTIDRVRELLAAEPGVACALVFGSRARSDYGEESDLDVAVRAPGVDLLALAARLSIALRLEVDVIDLDRADIPLLRSVIDDGVPVASNVEGALGQFHARALSELETDGPWYDRMALAFLERLANGSPSW